MGVLSFSGAVAYGQTLVVPPNQATQTLTEFQRETQRRVWEMSAPKGARREVVVAFAATNAAGYERVAQTEQAPKPDYPTETIAAARSGTVKLDVAIDAQGKFLALRTRNVAGALRAMQSKGYRTTTPEAYTGNAAAGILAVGGVYDPNGNVIELIELAPGLTTSRLQEVYGTDDPD